MEYLQYTPVADTSSLQALVLNLVISGIPSIPMYLVQPNNIHKVLNLVISGIPSILQRVSGTKLLVKF